MSKGAGRDELRTADKMRINNTTAEKVKRTHGGARSTAAKEEQLSVKVASGAADNLGRTTIGAGALSRDPENCPGTGETEF